VVSLPYSHVLQSWEWGEFKRKYGWRPTRLLFEEDGRIRAAASILTRQVLRFGVMYVPKGPALDYSDSRLLGAVLDAIEQAARRERAIFVKIDPDVAADAPVVATLWARGWRPSTEQIQFRNTITLDLTCPPEELLAAMKPKTRYNIRLAARRGVEVVPGRLDNIPQFYRLYVETGTRDGFIVRPFAYYQDAWSAFIEAGLAKLLLARYRGQVIAGLIVFRFGPTAWFMYGASTSAHRDVMPNHLLQWEAISWARAQGCTRYDFWGAPDRFDEGDPLWGVYHFKEGFGGTFVRHIGAYDFPTNRLLYRLYVTAMPRYLDLLRRRHRQGLELTGD
jgi:lipid II:glycine glycyltransferase (peptidoglycan interpeptide bridge formation enzyme)